MEWNSTPFKLNLNYRKRLVAMRNLILGIDFNNLVYSSYYGDKLYNSNMINVNAIQMFFIKLRMLNDTLTPKYIFFANDLSREKTFRRKLYKPYKASRKPTDMDIVTQMKYCLQIAALAGFPFISHIEYEADDILGMVANYAQNNDLDMLIISSDKDLYQLIDDNVCVLSPKNKDMIDRLWLYERYKLTPKQWIDLKILMGDRSDNIPGIEGIGETSALKLLHEFESIDGIFSHMSSVRPVLRDKLEKGKEFIPLMRELVTIKTDYNLIEFNPNQLNRIPPMVDELYNVLRELELYSLFNVMKYSLLGEAR